VATKTGQRVFIWVIAVVMTVGTIAGFVAMVLAPGNAKLDQARATELAAQYQKDQAEYQKKVDVQTAGLSAQYYDTFAQYASYPSAFDAGSVKEVTTNDLVVGTGEEITDATAYNAYYIGWNPTGKIFDQSIDGTSLKSPIPGKGLIEGWTKGVKGMKIGGVREITIPAALAYGEGGSGEDIPPNTPIKFIVMPIPEVKAIPQPAMSPEMAQYYGQ
jgi:FKBP-type peptidyl-prolyl cis-trans isomerase FkpA